jgi:hypothetical protein
MQKIDNKFIDFLTYISPYSRNDPLLEKYENCKVEKNDKRKFHADPRSVFENFPTGDSLLEIDFSKNLIGVNHLAGTGGNFVCLLISCSPSLSNKDYYEGVCNNLRINSFWWYPKVKNTHERLYKIHSEEVEYEMIDKFHKFVHVSFDFSEDEIQKLQQRLLHITHTRMTRDRYYTNLICKVHKKLQTHLRNNCKNYFEFPFLDLYDEKLFLETCGKLYEFCNIERLNDKDLKKLLSLWHKANTKHYLDFVKATKNFKLAHPEGVEPPAS